MQLKFFVFGKVSESLIDPQRTSPFDRNGIASGVLLGVELRCPSGGVTSSGRLDPEREATIACKHPFQLRKIT